MLTVLFVAVREDFAQGGIRGNAMLFFHIVNELGGIAKRVKGISGLKLFLTNPPTAISVSTAMALTTGRPRTTCQFGQHTRQLAEA